jgi:hypothetical protein
VALSVFSFFTRGYFSVASLSENADSQWIVLGYIFSIILFFFFAWVMNMNTKSLFGIIVSSMLVALFVESFATKAGWWTYTPVGEGFSFNGIPFSSVPVYPLFSIPMLSL